MISKLKSFKELESLKAWVIFNKLIWSKLVKKFIINKRIKLSNYIDNSRFIDCVYLKVANYVKLISARTMTGMKKIVVENNIVLNGLY